MGRVKTQKRQQGCGFRREVRLWAQLRARGPGCIRLLQRMAAPHPASDFDPGPVQVTIFDRSWYGRVLVECVKGLAAPTAR